MSVRRLLPYIAQLLFLLAAAWLAWSLARRIGPPAIADTFDTVTFTATCVVDVMVLMAGARSAWRFYRVRANWRAGIALPIMMKEMRSQMRGVRASILIFVCAILTVIITLSVAFANWPSNGSDALAETAHIGRYIFNAVMLLSAILVTLIAPALTAGAISREREGQTLEMLLLTRMSDGQIIWGKLLSALSLLWIVLFCTLPALGVGFILGGVTGVEWFGSLALLIAATLCFGAIGLWCSSRFRRTAVAVTVAYVLCAVIVLATPLFTDAMLGMGSTYPLGTLLSCLPVATGVGIAATLLTNLIASRLEAMPAVRLRLLRCLLAAVLLIPPVAVWHFLPFPQQQYLQNNWDEYIEYADPLLAFLILQTPGSEVEYSFPFSYSYSIVANYEEDWPIVLSVTTLLMLITLLELSLTRRELSRLRGNYLLRT